MKIACLVLLPLVCKMPLKFILLDMINRTIFGESYQS
jgi:hypothetical protein